MKYSVDAFSGLQKGHMAKKKQQQLTAADEPQLESGEDMAAKALAEAASSGLTSINDDEAAASDELADTLNHLQNVIERNANNLNRIKEQLKAKRESLSSVFENDTQLSEASEEASRVTTAVKERRSQLQNDPQVSQLKMQIGELNEEKKELEETISNHLVNYYGLTNSKSFDTSDGDQWDFDIKAKVKNRKK